LSLFIACIAINVAYPSFDWSDVNGQICLRNLLQFLISEIISFLFFTPIIIVLVDYVLRKGANQFGCVYRIPLAHHSEFESDHAVPVNIGGYNIFFCTRCSGMLTGILIGVFIESFLFLAYRFTIEPGIAKILMIVLPIPGLIDWGTQRLGYRKSTDISRIITGLSIGFALHMTTLTEPGDTTPLLIIGLYFIVFGLLIYFGSKQAKKE
jgi:uncharacterized membrane protein